MEKEYLQETDFEIDFSPYLEYFNRIGKSSDNIILEHNFLSDDEIKLIRSYLNTHKDNPEFSGGKDLRDFTVKEENLAVYNLMLSSEQKIWDRIQERYAKRYNVQYKREPVNQFHFVKWHENMASGLHSDCERPDGTPAFHANFYQLNLSVLVYINDDYEGGLINFPAHNKSIKPKPGDMIMFPSNGAYRHEVTRIESGLRYTMPGWYTFDIDVEKELQVEYDHEDSVILWVNKGESIKGITHV